MKRPAVISLFLLLFCSAFAASGGVGTARLQPDSLQSLHLHTEGIKRYLIRHDTVGARELFARAIAADTTFAPAYYELGSLLLETEPARAVELSRQAVRRDTTNKWYLQLYGQALITDGRYDQALDAYRRLMRIDPDNPDVYRLLAALYEQTRLPFSAISVLDSADLRFGRIPLLSYLKRRLLIATRQFDRAIAEAEALVEAAPYEGENHLILGNLYSMNGRDSLARQHFATALRIDSTDVSTLMTIAEFHNRRRNYRAFLSISRRLFESDEMPIAQKIEQFGMMTSDERFYREFYPQINELAALLAIKYPSDAGVVDLYGRHLIASGELDRALELYKHHTTTRPAVRKYFEMVVDIETFKQRPDSVDKYVSQAIRLFPAVPEFYLARGHIHTLATRYNEAVKNYRASLRFATTDSLRGVIWGFVGDTYHAAGEQKKSYKAYDRALKYAPDNASVLNNYAYFLVEEEQQLERALAMSERAVELSQNNPTFLDSHAWILFKLGRLDEAKRSMQLAISLDGNTSATLQLHYGDILAATGEYYMAEVYWRKALENGYEDPEAIARRFEALKRHQTEKTNPE